MSFAYLQRLDIVDEVLVARIAERRRKSIDHDQAASLEKKQEGYSDG